MLKSRTAGKKAPEPRCPQTQLSVRTQGGGTFDAFFATVYIDDYLLLRVQHADDDRSALIASASLTSDHVRLFGP